MLDFAGHRITADQVLAHVRDVGAMLLWPDPDGDDSPLRCRHELSRRAAARGLTIIVRSYADGLVVVADPDRVITARQRRGLTEAITEAFAHHIDSAAGEPIQS